jgi:chemotaxis protein CheC
MIELHELEQDALTEIFNIGVGIAADALYQMVGEQVPLSVPVVELTSQRGAKRHFLDREKRLLCAIRQTYSGEFTIDAVLMFPQESSDALVRMMVGSDLPAEQLAEMTTDALAELGNIVLNAVISNLASTLKLSLEGSLPDVSVISSEAIFTQRAGSGGVIDENTPVLALMIDFELSTQRASGYLAFLMDIPSSELLIGQLTRYVNAF